MFLVTLPVSQETEDFFNQFDVICGTGYCEFMLKKLDKKRERWVLKILCTRLCSFYHCGL